LALLGADPTTTLSAAALTSAGVPLIGVGLSDNDNSGAVSLARSIGVGAIRIGATWSRVELVQGHLSIPVWLDRVLRSSRKEGAEPFLILGYGN
jgi:hypothetical protein